MELTLPSSQEEVLANLCQSYTLALEENLDRRFNQAAPVLEAFGIFNPTTLPAATVPEFMEYGVASVKILAGQFQFSEDHHPVAEFQISDAILEATSECTARWEGVQTITH